MTSASGASEPDQPRDRRAQEDEKLSPTFTPAANNSIIIISSSHVKKNPPTVVKTEETDSCPEDEAASTPPGLTKNGYQHLMFGRDKREHFVRIDDIPGTECDHCGLSIKGINALQHF